MKVPPHPAKFSDPVLVAIGKMARENGLAHERNVLDPFAGVGKIYTVFPQAVGVEIEKEWARADRRTLVGDSLNLRKLFPRKRFSLVVTSPCYGNRFADHHNAKDGSKRHTYKHYLGHDLKGHNSGAMQWGPRYREFHMDAWESVRSVMPPESWLILNISDHVRKGHRQYVERFHTRVLNELGFTKVATKRVKTPRQRHGENGEVRVATEGVHLFCRD